MESYADIIARRMRDLKMGARTLEAQSTYSYEHIRKLLRGESVQSQGCNSAICKVLGLDEDAMWEKAQQEKLQKRYGSALPTRILSPADPAMREMWPELSTDQRRQLIKMAEGFVAMNRAQAGFLAHAS